MGSECNPPRLLPFHTQLARDRRESVQPGMPEPDDTLREGGLWVAVRIVFPWVWKRQVVFDQRISLAVIDGIEQAGKERFFSVKTVKF